MWFLVKLFYSIILLSLWWTLIKYRKNVHERTWNWYWAEKYLGSGWTYLVLVLFWMFLIFLWAIYPFWGLELLKK